MALPEVIKPTNDTALIYRYVFQVFPLVKKELRKWSEYVQAKAEPILAEQALESIKHKSFHCLGGSIYALYPGVNSQAAIEFIVAYQTLSDYLDNLVDSLKVESEQAFQQLHLAMHEALEEGSFSDYYRDYPYKDDGGYIVELVKTCRKNITKLPSYRAIKDDIIWLAKLYSQLQTYKHLSQNRREEKLLGWAETHLNEYPEISAWEFMAATGSTLGIFCLYAEAFSPGLTSTHVQKIKEVYFPWIDGLHILLDYFIDIVEDRETKQLNFVEYYKDDYEVAQRLQLFLTKSLEETKTLPNGNFHKVVIQGLLAMYLSDPKGVLPETLNVTNSLLAKGGIWVRILYWLCLKLRKCQLL